MRNRARGKSPKKDRCRWCQRRPGRTRHHTLPRSMETIDHPRQGQVVYLCQSCHQRLHAYVSNDEMAVMNFGATVRLAKKRERSGVTPAALRGEERMRKIEEHYWEDVVTRWDTVTSMKRERL